MSQVAKRTKKARSPKSDLEERTELPKLRRSLRRRSLRFNQDFDHYLDDDVEEEDDDDEDDERLEKKLRLVEKLHPEFEDVEDDCIGLDSRTRNESGGVHAPLKRTLSASPSVSNPLKKRRIHGGDEDPDFDFTYANCNGEGSQPEEDSAGENPHSGAASCEDYCLSKYSVPDKKSLELILDKVQKKDVYGVFAEPVDPEELPDYHDIIEHPMDFSTVRKKLGGGSYLTLEQFENDVLLICSNAMQYNAPDTIYHKQARSMQELAARRFEALRTEIRCKQKDQISEDKSKPKETRKPKNTLEPLSSDFSSGATLTTHDLQNTSTTNISERPGKVELPVENRRGTYAKPVLEDESILSMTERESKELIPMGLHGKHAYARSLARFTAILGPIAWKIASKRIVLAVPSGVEFGRGWVEEYEPLPLPKASLSISNTPDKNNSQSTLSELKGLNVNNQISDQSPNPANHVAPIVRISAHNTALEVYPQFRADTPDSKARCLPPNGRPLHFRNMGLSWFHSIKEKQESLPPDLNISFQSTGSLDTPSSQPDLALQL